MPDPAYRTLLIRDGARHRIVNSLRLGSTITAETNGKPSAAATLDSDDGVLLPTLNVGKSASVKVTVSGGSGFLDGWIDFTQDGDFDDVGEHVLDDSPVAAGIQNLPISIPLAAKLGSTFARFRLSSARVTNPRGLAKDGEVEDYAVTVMLATPVIASMAATTESQRPEFKWSAVPGATSYTVFITNQSTGQSPFQTATVTGTSYTPVTDLGIGRFNIWVQAKNSAGKSIWSPQFNIQIATRTAIAPMDRRLITARPTLTWKALPGAARYDVLINDQLAGGPPILRDTNVTSPSYSPRGDMPLGLYRAWVRGIAQDGTPAGWSAMVEFYVVPAPVVVSGQNPTFDRTPTFAWQAVTGAASYTVLIKNLNSGATTLNKTNITDLSFTPSANLKDGAYRWWVLGKAANGTQGSWTTPFDIFIGGRTDILSPIGQTSNRRPTFQWKTVDGAIRYELWVNQVNGQAKYVHVTNLTAPSYTPLSNLQAGLYRAWVRSVSSTNESIWSNSLDFTIL